MVRSRDGYIEGKIVERKIIRLDPEDNYEHLKALLEYVPNSFERAMLILIMDRRKKEWQKQNEKKRSPFLHKLIKDARDGEYINCTVEVIIQCLRHISWLKQLQLVGSCLQKGR